MLALLGVAAMAKPVDVATARRVADTYMGAMGMRNTAALVDITAQTSFTEFYVFAAEEGGFVLVSGDDCVVPVLGYSTTSRFETKDMPENILGWLQDYEKEIRWWKERVSGGEVVVEDEWQMLLAGTMPPAPLPTAVSPMLTTTWNQSPRYNALCPADSNGNLSVAGCVATATAQVMKYHNHPATGYGSHTYTSDRTINGVNYNFPNLTANFGATTYQWANMPNALTGTSSTAQIDAVSTLIYHVGVAVEMRYSPSASGAQNYNTGGTISRSSQTALMKYFKYRPDMTSIARADYSDAEFSALLRAELDQQRPFLYSGSHTSGAHSFVFDGYDNNGKFHINWGWGGSHDGYFVMGSLNPGAGGIGGNSSGTYNMNNVALIGIRPNTNWSTTGTTTVTATATGNGSVSGGGSYNFGDTVTLLATANSGYRFNGWSDGCKFNPRQIIANGGNYTFTANIVPIGGDTVHFCPGKYNVTSYGFVNGGDNYWGIHLPASALNADSSLKAVQFYMVEAGTYHLTVYKGSSHSTVAARDTVTYTAADEDQWQTITLTTPVQANSDIWIILHFNGTGYPQTGTYYSGASGSFISGSNFSDKSDSRKLSAMVKGIFCSCVAPVDSTCFLTTFPYTQNFDDGTAPCWETFNANGGNSKWDFYGSTYGYNNTTCMGIKYADNSDDWLMSPTIALAGNYTLTWKTRIRSTSYPETYQVLWYDGSDTTQLFQETLSSTTYVDRSVNFYVPANTSGRIVFRYISDDKYYLYIDNISIAAASVQTQCTITAVSNNSAYGTVSGGGIYNIGATVTLTATAASGYHFVQWQDGNTSNPRTFTATGNATYSATFAVTQYTVTTTSNNNAWGTVSGGGTYNAGATATLTATAATGYQFVQWQNGSTANPISFTVNSNVTYTATFEAIPPTQYTITVASNNPDWGTVDGGGTYDDGTTITITANANDGYHFVKWQDEDTVNPRTITVTGNDTYEAFFDADQHEGVDDVVTVGISLYPNPASTTVTVTGVQGDLQLLDVTGRTIHTIKHSYNHTITIDVSAIPSGFYFLKNGIHHSSFIIQH